MYSVHKNCTVDSFDHNSKGIRPSNKKYVFLVPAHPDF